ncbi:hypothetical protein SNE40_000970 [Patella caerulea]|uniref:Major facilitator superfamily (MFS) profile domain-containing protein n=1 Tax=Patella caerulea TaxID=87958 RepID=A0AAN8Q2D2_PATCE
MLEDLIDNVGSFGKFQWMIVIFVMSPTSIIAMSMLVMAYGGMVPDWWCIPSEGNIIPVNVLNSSSIYYHNCNESSGCLRVYESYTRTVISKFDLVCDNAWIKPTVTSVQMGGVLVGAFIGGQSGDMFGRKKTIYTAILLHSIFNLIIAFSVNWQMFAALRFLIGGSIGAYLVLSSFPLEFVGLKRRALVSCLPFWTTGAVFLALASYLIHDWKVLHICIGAFTFPFVFGYMVVPESMRWLATKDRIMEAREVLEKIARFNGTAVPENAEYILRKLAGIERVHNEGGKKYTYIDIYRGWTMFKTSFCLQFSWCTCSMVYYGLSFGISSFSGNFYFNFFLTNIIDMLTFLPVLYLLGKIGRRFTCALSLFTATTACIVTLIVQKVSGVSKSPAITGLSLTAQTFTGTAWAALILLTSESYPTVIRYVGKGGCSVMARIGGILAPFIFNLSSNRMAPYIIMGVMITVSGICVLLLNETKDSALQDLIEEIDVNKDLHQSGIPVYDVSEDLKKAQKGDINENIKMKDVQNTYM